MKLLASLAVALVLASAARGANRCSKKGVGEVNCFDPSKQLCGVDRGTGNPLGCVSDSDCPAWPDYRVTCDGSSAFCCCKDEHPDGLICNELWNQNNDKVWKQACSLPELRGSYTCQRSWTTTTTTTPSPMPKHCLDYCKLKVPAVPEGPFKWFCDYRDPSQSTWHCPAPCPKGCDNHCKDGEHLDCPDPLTFLTTEPPRPPEEAEKPKKEGLSTWELVGIILGVLIVLLIMGVVVYCCVRSNQKQAPIPGPQSGAGEAQPVRINSPPQNQPAPQTELAPPALYPVQGGYPGATQDFAQSTQFAPQQANYSQQGATSSMPNMR